MVLVVVMGGFIWWIVTTLAQTIHTCLTLRWIGDWVLVRCVMCEVMYVLSSSIKIMTSLNSNRSNSIAPYRLRLMMSASF